MYGSMIMLKFLRGQYFLPNEETLPGGWAAFQESCDKFSYIFHDLIKDEPKWIFVVLAAFCLNYW